MDFLDPGLELGEGTLFKGREIWNLLALASNEDKGGEEDREKRREGHVGKNLGSPTMFFDNGTFDGTAISTRIGLLDLFP